MESGWRVFTLAVARRFDKVSTSAAEAAAEAEDEDCVPAPVTEMAGVALVSARACCCGGGACGCCCSFAGFVSSWARVGAKLGFVPRAAPLRALCRIDPADRLVACGLLRALRAAARLCRAAALLFAAAELAAARL